MNNQVFSLKDKTIILLPQDFTDYKYGYDIVHTGIVIHASGIDPFLKTKEEMVHQVLQIGGTPQHLYLCSDIEPIKVGDWVYHPSFGAIIKVENLSWCKEEGCKKILFTTDPSLDGAEIDGNTKALVPEHNLKFGGQSIEVNFLEEYCKRYNQKDKGEPPIYDELSKIHDWICEKMEGISQDQINKDGIYLGMYRAYKNVVDEIEKISPPFEPKGDIVIEYNDGNLIFK